MFCPNPIVSCAFQLFLLSICYCSFCSFICLILFSFFRQLCVCLSVRLPVCPSVRPTVLLSVRHLCPSLCLFVRLYICQFVHSWHVLRSPSRLISPSLFCSLLYLLICLSEYLSLCTCSVCSIAFGKFFSVQIGMDFSGGSWDELYDSVKNGSTTCNAVQPGQRLRNAQEDVMTGRVATKPDASPGCSSFCPEP